MSIIVLVDNALKNKVLKQALNKSSDHVLYLNDPQSVLNYVQQQTVDLVILDDHIINQDLLQLISAVRKSSSTPILLLCELFEQNIAIDALQAGADQYLYKPFTSSALLAHIDALSRRVNLEQKRLLFKDCSKQFSSMISRLPLTETETQLVQYLSKNDGYIVSKATLQKKVLKKDLSAFDRNLDVHISNIRRKMSKAGLSKTHIKTVHGKGYAFTEQLKHFSIVFMSVL